LAKKGRKKRRNVILTFNIGDNMKIFNRKANFIYGIFQVFNHLFLDVRQFDAESEYLHNVPSLGEVSDFVAQPL
jgi:predicted RNA-binding protein with PUA-like domain